MGDIINIYRDYTPRELGYDLGEISSNDTDEIHNALIVLVGIVASQQNRIESLENRLRTMEH